MYSSPFENHTLDPFREPFGGSRLYRSFAATLLTRPGASMYLHIQARKYEIGYLSRKRKP